MTATLPPPDPDLVDPEPAPPRLVWLVSDDVEDQGDEPARRFYRLRAPDVGRTSVAVTVRVTDGADLYLAIGGGSRRMYLTQAEAWTLWRCLSEAVNSLGTPPEWIRVPIKPTSR